MIIERIPPLGKIAVYALVDPRNKVVRYVGATKDHISARAHGHFKTGRKKNRTTPMELWIGELHDLGQEPLVKLIEVVEVEDWKSSERKWITHYRKKHPGLLFNVANGGPGGWRGEWSEEDKKRLSNILSGKPKSPEHRAKLREASLKRWREGRYAERNSSHGHTDIAKIRIGINTKKRWEAGEFEVPPVYYKNLKRQEQKAKEK